MKLKKNQENCEIIGSYRLIMV